MKSDAIARSLIDKIPNLPLSSCMALLFGSATTDPVNAAQVITTITRLSAPTVSQDRWRAIYTLTGASLSVDQGFTVLFDSAFYSDLLQPPAPVSPDWDVLSIQPDPLLSAPGFLDGLSLVANPSVNQSFVIDFVWLGTSPPGSQTFQIYDQRGTFQIVESGQTVVVPEPNAIFGIALFAPFALWVRRRVVR